MSFFKKLLNRIGGNATPLVSDADLELCAPVSGTLIPIDEVPDPVICERIAGDGCAFIPESDCMVSPCDGVITRLLSSNTAFVVRASCGTEIYVRFGIGTGNFQGNGFSSLKKAGDQVTKGEKIIAIDLEQCSNLLKSTVTSMIAIKSSSDIERVASVGGKVQAGSTPCMWVFLKPKDHVTAST